MPEIKSFNARIYDMKCSLGKAEGFGEKNSIKWNCISNNDSDD